MLINEKGRYIRSDEKSYLGLSLRHILYLRHILKRLHPAAPLGTYPHAQNQIDIFLKEVVRFPYYVSEIFYKS